MITEDRLQHPILELEEEHEFLYGSHSYELRYDTYIPHFVYTILSLG